MDFYLSASKSLGGCVLLLALQIEQKKKQTKKESNMQEYKSIIRKQVKGQNGLDVAHFSPYAERKTSVQLWEKTNYKLEHKIRYVYEGKTGIILGRQTFKNTLAFVLPPTPPQGVIMKISLTDFRHT